MEYGWLVIAAFFASLGIALAAMYLSHRYECFIDCHHQNKPQKFHNKPISRAGGIGIFVVLAIYLIWSDWHWLPAVSLVFMSGLFEDFHNSVTPRVRLALQVGGALIATVFTGAVVTYLGLGVTLPYTVGVVFSIFAIVGMTNAVNIIDGFNGLASGTILLIILAFGFVSASLGDTEILRLLAVLGGAVAGFFVLVFPFGKIFLGDGGAYLLGFTVGVVGIALAGRHDEVSPWFVLAVFIYPVWEVLFSIGRKLSRGYSPFKPDGYHFHMLVYRQLTQNNPLTSLVILAFIAPFMAYAVKFAHCSICNIKVIFVFIIAYSLVYAYLYRREVKQRR